MSFSRINLLYFLLFGALFSYILTRAATLSITHDEALTYQIIQGDPNQINTANHHLLNTWLSGFTLNWFHLPEFGLRFPNVLAFACYFFYSLRILKSWSSPKLVLPGILLLTCNPFLLDYFSLARGYGLSIGLLMASLYYLLKVYHPGKFPSRNPLVPATLFASLALLANLNLLNIFLLIQAFLLLALCIRPQQWSIIRTTAISLAFLVSVTCLIYALQRLFFLRDNAQLYFGVNELRVTLNYLITTSFYTKTGFDGSAFLRLLLVVLMLSSAFIGLIYERGTGVLRILTLLIGLSFVALVAEHYLFDALYPVDRASLYLYPLITLLLLLGAGTLVQHTTGKALFTSLLVAVYGMTGLYLAVSLPRFNTEKYLTWTEFAHIRSGLLELETHIQDGAIHTVENSWVYEPVIHFYRDQYGIHLEKATRDTPSFQKEFVILLNEKTENPAYRLIAFYPEDALAIYQRKKSAQ